MADLVVWLQGAPVLGCRPGCEAMGMRVAGQGHGPSPLVGCAATWWAQSGRLVECLGALSEGLGRGGLPRFDLAVELIRALTRGVLSGSSSRSRATFFCFAKRKYPKKRRPGGRVLRCAADSLRFSFNAAAAPIRVSLGSREALIYSASGMKCKEPGAQKTRHIMKIGEFSSTARRGNSPAQPINQCFLRLASSPRTPVTELAPALRTVAQTVLADYPALNCDARRDLREPVRGDANTLANFSRRVGNSLPTQSGGQQAAYPTQARWMPPFVGCNQRASALHRMVGLSQASGAMRCASIAPCLGFRRSDFSPTAMLNKHRVGLKSDLQSLRWRRVGNSLPTQSGGQLAAYLTSSPQPISLQGRGAMTAPLQPALVLPCKHACKLMPERLAGRYAKEARDA
jgi:hypothetical protein